MRKIRLENFRCYKEQEIEFKSGINLLVGDNASGKTSILKACKYVLSSFFAGFSDENTKWISFKKDDFSVLSLNGENTPLKPIIIKFINREEFLVEVEGMNALGAKWYVPANFQTLTLSTKKRSKVPISGIKIYKAQSAQLLKNYFENDERKLALPLFAYFAAKDYENTNAQAKKKFKQYNHIPSFGYFECLDDKTNFNNWMTRLLVLEEGKKNLEDINIVKFAIEHALGHDGCDIINSVDIRDNQRSVYFILSDGREIASENLSDGYKRVINIVVDLAFRCVHLNRSFYGKNACLETKGTVLIDEIDLHLHPTLQSTILKGLRNAFPNLQFIVTTHAPMVMSSVESNDENVVYKLDYSNEEGYSVNEVVTYGMDLSTISKVVLDQEPRDPKSSADFDYLFELIDEDKIEDAKTELERLKAIYLNNPELTRAETMLNFVIFDNEEDS